MTPHAKDVDRLAPLGAKAGLYQRKMHDDIASLIEANRFFEYVYAVLQAWGMPRMGKQPARSGRSM